MVNLRTLVGLLGAMILLGATRSRGQTDAEELARIAAAHADARVVALDAVLHVGGGGQVQVRYRWKRPNLLRVEYEGIAIAGATGEVSYQHDISAGHWYATAVREGLPVACDVLPGPDGVRLALSLTRLAGAPSPWLWLGGDAQSPSVRAGESTRTVLLPNFFGPPVTETFTFDAQTRRLREVVCGDARLVVTSLRTDVELAADEFAFRPPRGVPRWTFRNGALGDLLPAVSFVDLGGETRTLETGGRSMVVMVTDPYNNGPWRTYEQLAAALRSDDRAAFAAPVTVLFWDYRKAGRAALLAQLRQRRFAPVEGVTYGTFVDDAVRARLAPASPATLVVGGDRLVWAQIVGWASGLLAEVTAALRAAPAPATQPDEAFELWYRGDLDAAARTYARAVEERPESNNARRQRSWFLSTCESDRHRDPAAALAEADRALACSGARRRGQDRMVRAAALAAAGDFAGAVAAQEQAIALEDEEVLDGTWSKRARTQLALYRARRPHRQFAFRDDALVVYWSPPPIRAGAEEVAVFGCEAMDPTRVAAGATWQLELLSGPAGLSLGEGSVKGGAVQGVKVRVPPDATPGVHDLRARLTYDLVGPTLRRQVELTLTLAVER
jgi:hypothetical protein